MELTQDDVHIFRVLFNKETHAMTIALYGERAKEIYNFVCDKVLFDDFFRYRMGCALEFMLREKSTASFFFENNLIDFSCFNNYDISSILIWSPICEKIWDSGKLDPHLHKLNDDYIKWIFEDSSLRNKIKASGKLKLK